MPEDYPQRKEWSDDEQCRITQDGQRQFWEEVETRMFGKPSRTETLRKPDDEQLAQHLQQPKLFLAPRI
jgi:hypothetical protein